MRLVYYLMASCFLSSCTKFPEFPYNPNYAKLSESLPSLGLSYGDDLAVNFSADQVHFQYNGAVDSANAAYTISGDNGYFKLLIEIKAIDITEGQYDLDGINGTVDLYKNGRSQIGSLVHGSFSISFYLNERKTLNGYYYGQLFDPLTGSMKKISGTLINLR